MVADLPRLPYAESVINETLRVYPTVWMVGRENIEPVELGGYRMPVGTTFFMPQWVIHRDARWFDDPEAFRPERWEGGLMQRLHRYAYFPFGGGPRLCIGNNFALMESALVLATVAQKFRLRLADDARVSPLPTMTLATGTWDENGGPGTVSRRLVYFSDADAGADSLAVFDPLQLDHVAIEPAAGHQLGVAAGLDDCAFVQDQDAIGVADRAQAMCDHERGAAAQQLFEALLDETLTLAVQVAGCFVEDEDPGIGQHGSRDRKALALAAAQAHSALTDHGVVPVAQAFDEFCGVGGPGCLFDARGRRPAVAVGDVLGDRAVEEKDVLFNDSQEATVALDLNLTEIDAIKRDGSRARVVESSDQIAKRCLTRSAAAHECDRLARTRRRD